MPAPHCSHRPCTRLKQTHKLQHTCSPHPSTRRTLQSQRLHAAPFHCLFFPSAAAAPEAAAGNWKLPYQTSMNPSTPKFTEKFRWCSSCIPLSSQIQKPECVAVVCTRNSKIQTPVEAMCEPQMMGPATKGKMLEMRFSTGCAYAAATATGEVHVWWILWMAAYNFLFSCRKRCM